MQFKIFNLFTLFTVMVALAIVSCTEEIGEGVRPNAAFTYTFDTPDSLTVTFSSTVEGSDMIQWDFGDRSDKATDATVTHTYAKGGKYMVTFSARAKGGTTVVTEELVLPIPPAPPANDLVKGGNMSDASNWTQYGTGATLTTATFENGVLNFSNGTGNAQTNVLIFQEFEVQANVEYTLSADVSGSGATNSWLEFYISPEAPVDGADFSTNLVKKLSTWDGCMTSAFSGDLFEFCDATVTNKVTFPTSGPVYLVIKAGSWDGNLGAEGITIDNVSLTFDPNAGPANLLVNGDMSSDAGWLIVGAGAPNQTSVEYADGMMMFSNGAATTQSNVLVYQAVEVVAGQQYTFSADIAGQGATNSWFEVYMDVIEPQDGTDYTTGEIKKISTWDNCILEPFEGDFFEVCPKDVSNTISFETGGTYYLVIKSGSWDGSLGEGIMLDNVKLTPVAEPQPVDLVENGDMSAEDGWEIIGAGAPNQTVVEYVDGTMLFTNGTATTQSNVLVYQAVEVKAGKSYTFSADISGNGGAVNSWIEVYLDDVTPTDGTDYTTGEVKKISTWDGCITEPFSGDFFEVCPKEGSNVLTFDADATMYLVIKSGSWDGTLNEGITLDNVKLVEVE